MVCRTNSSGNACNCYSSDTPTSVNECDCAAAVYGAEYYYNGSYCVSSKSFNQSCNAGYECQLLTQLTTCTGSKCVCSTSQYFKSGTSKCETLLIINQTCSQTDACNSGLGLSCQSGTCKCNSTQFWKLTGCINYYIYSQGTCQVDDQCLNNMICRTGTSVKACDCYTYGTLTSVGDCDCPAPVYGSEYYYNGSYCVSAKTINASCSSNWTCQEITNELTCISGICTCSANYLWNGTKCNTSPPSWTFHRGSCFRIGNVKVYN